MNIRIELIDADKEQPRQLFIEEEMEELESSIRANGILQPLIVEKDYGEKGRYLLLDGERRYRCAKKLNFEEVPVVIVQGPLSFADRTIKRFHIQEKHKNWTLFDRAASIAMLRDRSNLTLADIAERLDMKVPLVHAWISMTSFTKEGQKMMVDRKMKFTFLLYLVRVVKGLADIGKYDQLAVERVMLQRYECGELNIQSVNRLSQLVIDSEISTKLKLRLVEDLDYTVQHFFEDSGAAAEEQILRVFELSNELMRQLEKLETFAAFDDQTQETLKRLSVLIAKKMRLKEPQNGERD